MGEIAHRDPEQYPGNAGVVLIGVPQDIGVRRNGGRPGAEKGPEAIRRFLYRLTPYDLETRSSVPPGFFFDAGDVHTGGSLEDIHQRLEEVVGEVCTAGLVPLVIGGGHDITYPALSGAAACYGTLGAFNFDPHLDVRPPEPERNSGTSFRMLIDEGKLAPTRFVEFGIQPFANARTHLAWLEGKGGNVQSLDLIRRIGLHDALKASLRLVVPNSTPFYGTLDLDAVRASDAPGVSATMPDGFSPEELLTTAHILGCHPHCIALDIAEMNPAYDIDNRTAKLAAHAVMRFVSGVLSRLEKPKA